MLLTVPLLRHITTGLLRIPLSETATFSEIRRKIRPPLLQLLKHGVLAELLGNHLAPIRASIRGKNPFRFEDLRSLAAALETPEGQSALAVFPDPLVTQGLNLGFREGEPVIDFEPRLRKGPETDLTALLFGLYYALSGNPNLSCEAFWRSYAAGYRFFDKLGLPSQISDQLIAIVQKALRTRQRMLRKGPGDDSFENIAQLREKFEALRDTLEERP